MYEMFGHCIWILAVISIKFTSLFVLLVFYRVVGKVFVLLTYESSENSSHQYSLFTTYCDHVTKLTFVQAPATQYDCGHITERDNVKKIKCIVT